MTEQYRAASDSQSVVDAAKLACGLLWMTEYKGEKAQKAFEVLRDAFGGSGSKVLGEAIKRAMDAGYEVDAPVGFDYIEWH